LPDRHRGSPDNFVKLAAFDKLHAEVALAVPLADFVDRNGTGMLQPGCGFGLETETFEVCFGGPLAQSDDFQRDDAIETLLAGAKYYALSAAANLLEQFVITEIHQKRHRTAGVTAPGYRFVGAETCLQQAGAAGVLWGIGGNGCSAFATKCACCDSHRPAIPFT